jgi:hypothetical protein
MLIFDRRIYPESLSVEFGYTLYTLYTLYTCTLVQGVREMHGKILTMSYWLHVELGKNI